MDTARSLSILDISVDGRFSAPADLASPSGSVLSVPILQGDLVVGVINATNRLDGGVFTVDDERVIEEFQAHAALLIEHAQMREQLAQTVRVKEQLTRMLVHDLKGPLAAIVANLDVMLMDLEAESPVDVTETSEMLHASRASCNTLIQMVLNLLDIARAGDDSKADPAGATSARLSGALGSEGRSLTRALPAHLVVSDVAGFLDDQGPMLKAIGRHRSVTVKMVRRSDTPAAVAFDPALLSRILINLTMNAVEHTPEGGEVRIVCEPADGHSAVPALSITVSDDGLGVPEDLRDRIFDAYFTGGDAQTSRVRGNHGLGLAFCKLACRAQDGQIELLPKPPDSGPRCAAFRVVIPRPNLAT